MKTKTLLLTWILACLLPLTALGSKISITFDVANSGAEGVAPAEVILENSAEFTIPKNFTLYKAGYTLTAWTDGTNNYATGQTITIPEVAEFILTPVFTLNNVSLADRTEPVILKYNFGRDQGAPAVYYMGQTGIWVAQANVNGTVIDVKADFDTKHGKFANGNWNDWAQMNNGTKWAIPSCKGAVVSMEAYSDISTTTIDGKKDYTPGKTISYTVESDAETVDVVIGDGSYYRYIQVNLPVPNSKLNIDADGYYLLSSAKDWKEFAAIAEENPEANAKMTADIDLGDDQTMIGRIVPYKGIFNGQGHLLTVNIDLIGESAVAPFSFVEGATIKNLHVNGTLRSRHSVGGIVAQVYGQESLTTISNCWSSSLMYSQGYGSGYGTIGGIVSENHGVLIIEDCLFDGQFADHNTYFNGGIVANTFYDLTIRNTLNVGNYPSQSTSGTFYRTDSQRGPAILENVYYKNACGTPQGTQVTDEQLADGTVTALLQNGRSEEVWVQGHGTPVLSSDKEIPMLSSVSPVNGSTDVPTRGSITLSFNEPVKLVEGVKATLNDIELTPIVNDSIITFEYSGLDFKKTYTFTLPANSVTDWVGNHLPEEIKISFTTSEHPTNAILPFGQFSHQPWLAKSKQNPEEDWYKNDYDDSEWETISGPICSEKVSEESFYYVTPFYPEYGKYWLRRHFVLNSICSEKVFLYVSHDDDCIVYLNGVEVYNNNTTIGTFVVSIDNSLLKVGDNVLAAYVYDRIGNIGLIDYGLYTDADVETYVADIFTDKLQYLPGETVKISGMAVDVANAELEVYVLSNGVKQVIKTMADIQGNFAAEWMPMSRQMGRFTIGASYQGTDITTNPVQIDVIGLRRTSNNYITCETVMGVPFTGELEVENPGLMDLHFSGVEILSKPDNCEVSIDCPEVISAGGKAVIAYTLEGSTPSTGRDWELVQLRISTEEGATVDVTLYTYCRSAQAVLVANENTINTTMTKGSSRDYPLYISNQGKGATGKIRLSLPGVAWMTAVTPMELPSLDYGETATVMLRLTPSDDLALNVPLTGTIGVNCENGNGIAIGYSIEPVSGQTGTLTVDVVDEYTQYAENHPHVNGATVEVLHPTTGAVIAQGLTASDGHFNVELSEGYYAISVKAEKHEEYSGYVMVDPGREKIQEVFISYEAITYSWSMEETEIVDEYEITTTATYETNVPKPVLVITLPNDKPKPNEIFPVTVTNHGLINTEHVDLTTVINIGFTIEILNRETLDVLGPEQSHNFYCFIKDEDGLWDSSCINAYFLADGYYQCYGLQHVQARADMYRCNRTSSDTGGGGGSWPGAGPSGPSFDGSGTVTGGASGGTTPWISWPCESCPARVKLEIVQTVSMSRPAYRGTLMLVNGHESNPITNVRLNLTITGEDGATATDKEFAVEVESLEAFGGDAVLPGNWTLAEGQTGKATVLFIPTQDAAPDGPKKYTFSGTMNCTDPFSGQELTLPLNATTFTIQPLPNLELTYLMQRDVYGDDPLTPEIVEPIVPAEFALIINNKGNGEAKNVRILTEQPKVTENDKGLLINFAIIRSQVNGDSAQLVLSPVIANDFGTIPAHSQAYAQWWLESSLLGHFISYDIEATHLTNYGNANLSLIDTVTIHEMVHGFSLASDEHGLTRRGFLVNDIEDTGDLPDVIYFTDATKEEVRIDAGATIEKQGDSYLLTLSANENGWYYGSLTDPTNGSLVLTDVVRLSDSAVIPTNNVWQTDRTLRDGRDWLYEHRLHFVARLPQGGDSYQLTFKTPEEANISEVAIGGSRRLRLWPLPMGEWLYMSGSFSEAQSVEIYDMRGTRRMQARHVKAGTALHTGSLPSGLYVVTVQADGQTIHRKILKK